MLSGVTAQPQSAEPEARARFKGGLGVVQDVGRLFRNVPWLVRR
jgi:hypothetical protein